MTRTTITLCILLLLLAVSGATPPIAHAQSCVGHDDTLTLNADGTPDETSFTTSVFCTYKIEIDGQYKYKDALSNNADAFYRSEEACDPDTYDADHCFAWDFRVNNGGWVPQAGSPARATWTPLVGWRENQFCASLYCTSSADINRSTGSSATRTVVRVEVDFYYERGSHGPENFRIPGFSAVSSNWDGLYINENGGTFTTSIRLGGVLSTRFNAWANPRGQAIIRTFKIWYDGAVTSWTGMAQEWFEHENLIFEPETGTPAEIPPPLERDPDGEYEFQWNGTGDKFRFYLDDDNTGDGESGSISVRVYSIGEYEPRIFRRPLEFSDVDTTYDWSDSNGAPEALGTHCQAVDAAYSTVSEYLGCNQLRRVALDFVPSVVVQTASSAFAPVHAVAAGTVVERRALLPFECYDMTLWNAGIGGDGCILEIPNWATPDDRALFIRSLGSTIYLVRVEHSDGSEMRYLVTNPRVSQGQSIRDQCVLGQTMPTGILSTYGELLNGFDDLWREEVGAPPSTWSFFRQIINTVGPAPAGAVVMGFLEEAEDDYEFLGPPFSYYDQIILEDYSSPSNSCDTTANFADCVSINPQFFNDGEYWISDNPLRPALWTNPGVILEAGARVVLPNLPLDPETAYGASAQIEQLTVNPFSNGRVRIEVGQSSYTESVFGLVPTIRLEEQLHSPTLGSLYDIAIENVGENDLRVHYFCLTEGAPAVAANCLFTNYSFDMGITGWETDGAIPTPGLPGSVQLEHDEYIRQEITLHPDSSGPHEYTVEIEANVPASSGGEIYMSWGATSMSPIHVIPLIGFNNTFTTTRTFTVSATDTRNFVISAHLPELGASEPADGAITIYRVCIRGPYPGQSGGGIIDQPEGCGDIAFPDEATVQEALQWHWWQIDKFNRCTLMPRLTDIYKVIVKGFSDLANQFKYWRQVLYSFSAWTEAKLFPWLAGYMSNITPGTVVVGDGGCNNLFCLLETIINSVIGPVVQLVIDLISQAANLLLSVIAGLIALFISLLSQLFTLLQIVLQVFFGLIQQFIDAEPTPLPGLPDCAATPTESICVVWWVADNTIFSGPGSAIIPLIVSILYIQYALWVVAEIKAIIVRAGEAL